ncbi:hypothetical protein K2173_019736 [Erythroxylum novogranatense]|uniref:Uncharacterized protein n=1 Tax=Erythroxylum novogranatense TaxID=1862640 RepID=A0AAV8SM33_9ROSI|nr:hypothetical protein K2173_019736 [Erythroxylum novogranatense]
MTVYMASIDLQLKLSLICSSIVPSPRHHIYDLEVYSGFSKPTSSFWRERWGCSETPKGLCGFVSSLAWVWSFSDLSTINYSTLVVRVERRRLQALMRGAILRFQRGVMEWRKPKGQDITIECFKRTLLMNKLQEKEQGQSGIAIPQKSTTPLACTPGDEAGGLSGMNVLPNCHLASEKGGKDSVCGPTPSEGTTSRKQCNAALSSAPKGQEDLKLKGLELPQKEPEKLADMAKRVAKS